MSGMDLVEFLNARLDEDERIASAAIPGPWEIAPNGEVHSPRLSGEVGAGRSVVELVYVTSDHEGILSSVQEGEARHIARHDPARVLAEVAAKRRIIELLTDGYRVAYDRMAQANRDVLRFLAHSYADHSDYREEAL